MKQITKLGMACFILSSMLFAKEVEVKILGTSDVHGRISPWDYSTDEASFAGGYSQISTIVKEYREKTKNLLVVDLGDAIQDNGIEKYNDIYSKENRHPVMDILNEMKYDIFIPGNHEFNFGMDFLDKALSQFKGKVLASNVYTKSGKQYYTPSTVVEVEGVKIGIIGVTTPLTEQFEAGTTNLRDLKFYNPTSEVKKEVEKLKKSGVNSIVLLAHMGLPNENNIPDTGVTDIAKAIPEIDVIFAGHFHKNVSKELINGVLVTEPDKYGAYVSEVSLKFDIDDTTKVVKLLNKDSKTISVKNVKSDKKIEDLYEKFHNKLREEANIVIGETKNDLVPKNEVKGIPSIYTVDSGLATLFGEVGFYFSKADVIALSIDQENAKLDKGTIKTKDINYNYRYTGGEVSIYEVTGKDLKDYLEWSAAYFNTIKDGDLLLSFNIDRRSEKYATFDFAKGVKYDIDLREEAGNRIKNFSFDNGTLIKDDTVIKLGMNSYRMERLLGKGGALEGRKNIKKLWSSEEQYGSPAGTVRYMTAKYISEVKKGTITTKASNNWKIIGLPTGSDVDLAKKLINDGKLSLINKGTATNIKSITLDDIKSFK